MSEIWAKDNGITLRRHTEDILNSFSQISNRLKRKIDDDLKKSIEWSIRLHDIGKVLPYFQIRTLKNKKYKPFEITINIYHSLLSVLFINQEKLRDLVGEEDYRYVLSAIAYHHWKNKLEYDLQFGSDTFEYFKNQGELFFNSLIDLLKKSIGELLQGNNDIIDINMNMLTGLSNGLSFAEYVTPPYQLYWLPKRIEVNEESKKRWILISGFLQRCDHYSSFCEDNEMDTGSLPIESDNLKFKDINKKIKNIINIKNSQQENLWQEEILNEEYLKNNVILIAPTGCGKTEFAFLWSNGDKFFYTLPLRSAVEQIYDRAKGIFGEDKTGLLHSDADVYLLGDTYDMEKVKVYEVSRQLSYPVIVSTGDQFFPYGLRPPGYERIYATFSYSRLVIDEVQAYDPKAAAIIVKYIEDIYRLGGKFLLMTATLPEYVKKEIENRIGSKFKEINKYENEKNTYKNLKKHKITFKPVLNKVNNKKTDFTFPDDLITEILNQANKGKRVMVVLNTVKLAEEVYKKVKIRNNHQIADENIILFHSRFTLNEKRSLQNAAENKFKNPKPDNENVGKVLIATQVVEAALDLDADVLYTEIAPMDALVQRMGRVYRRYKEQFQLEENDSPNIYIVVFKNGYESGNGKVYEKELIEKTLIILDNADDIDNIDYDKYYVKKDKRKYFDIDTLNLAKFDDTKTKKGKVKQQKDGKKLKTILLSEYGKFQIVNKLYKDLNPDGKYLSEFYKTLDILDAGFMSDRREEAQRIFREILNADIVLESREEEFYNKINELLKTDFNYTVFKKEIVAEFVISIPLYKILNKRKQPLSVWIENINIEDKKKKQKLLKWCEGIYITKDTNGKISIIDNLNDNIL